jgi:hypothetical protein
MLDLINARIDFSPESAYTQTIQGINRYALICSKREPNQKLKARVITRAFLLPI